MATMCLAMWLQAPDLGGTDRLIVIFIGLVAIAMVAMAIALIVVAVAAAKAVKGMSATAEEFMGKVLPLIAVTTEIGKTSQALLQDTAPKIRQITDNLVKTSDALVETSNAARVAVQRCDATIADANLRAQRQMARVDGMVTATLTATVEAVEAIGNGIRGPAQKIAGFVARAKEFADGVLAKMRSTTSRGSSEVR